MANFPVHNNPKPENAAKAPYNFVPLPERVVTVDPNQLPDQDRYYPDRHTGWLDCELTTETPLYIRAALEVDEFTRSVDEKAEAQRPFAEQIRNKSDFFYTADKLKPVIPGSSLRGLLRSLVEIVSYSKVQWVTDRQLVYRAVGEGDQTTHGRSYRDRLMRLDGEDREDGKRYYLYTPLMEAGYMHHANGEWYIQPAQRIGGTTFARISQAKIPQGLQPVEQCRNAFQIWVRPSAYQYHKVRGGFIRVKTAYADQAAASPTAGFTPATLAVSGWIKDKKTEVVIFPVNRAAKDIHIEDGLVRAYREQVTKVYADQSLQGYQRDSLLGSQGVLVEGHPVFYLIEKGKLIFFGHCMMLRLPYRQGPIDFVPKFLRQEEDTDLAEAIFGYTKSLPTDKSTRKERAYAGRVFVSDARTTQRDVWWNGGQPFAPKILGGPKPTTFQHYLTQQKSDPIPTGGLASGNQPRTKMELTDYASPTPEETVLRGSKLYWHRGRLDVKDVQEPAALPKRDTQHTLIKPIKPGVPFAFKIRFENLANEELGALLWVLNVSNTDTYRLKLGMGKPYGLGAIKVTSTLHIENRAARYQGLLTDNKWAAQPGGSANAADEALRAFEDLVIKRLGYVDGTRLTELNRIKALLAMLSWPGPDLKQTRYLEIEYRESPTARKVNEYKSRPVLPDPLKVAGLARSAEPSVTAQSAPPTGVAARDRRNGIVDDIQPAKRSGRVRDAVDGKIYHFTMQVIKGDTPAKKAAVEFELQDGRVVWLKRK